MSSQRLSEIEENILTPFALTSVLISLAALASFLNYRYIRLPTTIGVMLVALVASLAIIIAGPYAGGFQEKAAALLGLVNFDHLVLHGMLAFLLFAGAIHVDLSDLAREWQVVSLLAVAGTALSTAIVGGLTWLLFNWIGQGVPLIETMLLGALISPTDPIAVLAIVKSAGAREQLEVQIVSESLFNDGIGVVLFMVLLELSGRVAAHAAAINFHSVALLLLREVGGGVAVGFGAGFAVYHMLRRVDNYQVEVLLTLALAMGGFALADEMHLSAPIAIVVAGLFIGNRGRAFAMSEKTREHVDMFWELIDEILNAVLFLLIGLEILVLPRQWNWYFAGMLTIIRSPSYCRHGGFAWPALSGS